MQVGVKVLLKKEVLDSQGRAVEAAARELGFKTNQIRVGRYVVLDVDANNKEQAIETAKQMALKILHNPLIETFEVEVL